MHEILAKIESDKNGDEKPVPDSPLQRLTPSQRAAARLRKDAAALKSELKSVVKPDDAGKSDEKSVVDAVLDKVDEVKTVVSDVKEAVSDKIAEKTSDIAAPAPPAAKTVPEAEAPKKTALATVGPANAEIQDAKTKLQRVFGKPVEDAKSPFAKKVEVIDSSVYRKPSKSGSGKSTPDDGFARADKALAEVQALRQDLENQAQWEGVRMQKALYAQLVEDKTMAAKETAEMARKHADAMERMKTESVMHLENMLTVRTQEIEARAAERRDREVQELLAAREEHLRTELEVEMFERERKAAVDRDRQLAEASARVNALAARFDDVAEHNRLAREGARTAAAAFALCDAIGTDRPFSAHLDAVSAKTELAAAVAASIPREASVRGIPTLPQLQHSFGVVSRRGLGPALVPPEAAGSLWAQLLGAVMSRLKIRLFEVTGKAVADFDEPATDEDRIRQAQAYVEAGLLGKAVGVLDGVQTPLAKSILSDWLGDAKARCAADLAAGVLFADASIAQIALAATPPSHPAS